MLVYQMFVDSDLYRVATMAGKAVKKVFLKN